MAQLSAHLARLLGLRHFETIPVAIIRERLGQGHSGTWLHDVGEVTEVDALRLVEAQPTHYCLEELGSRV